MLQFHPPLSGMPLAFVVLLVVVECLKKLRRLAPLLGAVQVVCVLSIMLSTALAFLSGYQASSELGELSDPLALELGTHHALGRLLLCNSILLATFFWVARVAVRGAAVFKALYLIFLVSQIVLTLWVGGLGGDLVFEHGLGVQAKP